jgi:FO synthase
MDENISRAAGAAHGQAMDADAFGEVVAPLGRPLVQRTTLYGRVPSSSPAGPDGTAADGPLAATH